MNSMKKLLKGESTTALIDCGDNQFHAALSMEARSRSPLPPSPTTSTLTHDDAISSVKSLSQDVTLDFQVRKPRPLKPPRKCLVPRRDGNSNFEVKSGNDGESSIHYDEVEVRNEAWKVLGLDEVKHTDNVVEQDGDDYEGYSTSSSLKKEHQKPPVNKAPKILKQTCQTPISECYDRLNFFGSSSKLNVTKSGYKQVSPIPVASVSVPSPPSFNDYDEIEPMAGGIRLADDSHLGYALIRKEVKVDHQFHNEEAYAVVSKPKRV